MRLSVCHAFVLSAGLSLWPGAGVAQAQPSDAQTIKDLTSPGVLSVQLEGPGAKVWSKTDLQYFWERDATVVRKAGIPEYPDAKLEVGGIATYSIVGGAFPFKKFYVTYNRYSGIPAPSAQEVVALVKAELPKFLGGHYNSIVGDVQPIALAADPKWNWHTPNSVSLLVTTGYEEKVSYTQLEKKRATFEVRLYRDAIKSPWKNFISTNATETSLGKTTRDADAIKALKTLNVIDAERVAAGHMHALPDVSMPAFKTDLEAFAWLHQVLRAGDAKKGEAILRRALGPGFFETGSDVLLNNRGEELVQTVLKSVFKGKSSYAEQYGPDPVVKHYQPNLIEYWNADGRHFSRVSFTPVGGTYENGVKVGQTLKLSALEIFVLTDADEVARLRSIPDATRFAPQNDAKLLSQLGQQVADDRKIEAQAQSVHAITWTPFTSTQARLKIAFPAAPRETEGKMNDKYPMWTVEANHPQVLCRAVAVLYPTRLNRLQAQQTVESALQSLAQGNNLTIQRQSDLTEGTFGRLANLEGDGMVLKARVMVQGDVLYQLIISGTPATMAALNEREFFNSFEALR